MSLKKLVDGMNLKPIHVAVFIIALSVVALWGPYWVDETNEKVIVRVRDIHSKEIADMVRWSTELDQWSPTRQSKIIENPGIGEVQWKDGSIHPRATTWTVEVTETYTETIFPDLYGVPKLPIATVFTAAILVLILRDANFSDSPLVRHELNLREKKDET